MIHRFFFMLCCIVLLCMAPSYAVAEGRAVGDRPNVVILFMDDGGWGDLGCYGHPTIRTPHLDRMAAEGMRFTQFYSVSPACSASRYGLMTGRVPGRFGLPWVLGPQTPRGIHPREITIAEGLKSAGYATACYGKWHLGRPAEYLPLAHGFDEYFGLPYSNDMQPPKWVDLPLIEGNEVAELNPDQSRLTMMYTDRAIDFMQRHRDQPFFVYLPYAMPHVPLYPGSAFDGRSLRGRYGDVIEEIDASAGRILAALRELKLAENTLVFFTSDNGPWIIKGQEGGSAGLLRDGKGSTWEGGMREPAIAWWPGTVGPGTVCREVAATVDLLPTAFALAGVPLPSDRILDGVNLAELLRGRVQQVDRKPLVYYGTNGVHAVRKGRWKLHVKTSSQTGAKYFAGRVPLLFDLEVDPGEQYDLSGEHPQIVRELQGEIEAHEQELREHPSFWNRQEETAEARK